MVSLQDKRIIVSGGARGMGASHAAHLCELGASVLVADLLDSEGRALVDGLRSAGHHAQYTHLDVTNEQDWVAAILLAEAMWGGLDGLVNNAGVTGTPGGPAVEDLDAWNTTISVNQTGTYLGIRTVAPTLGSGGAIVNVSSILGFIGDGDYFAYTATQGAVRLMTRAAALQFAEAGIRVNSVCPGMVRTPMNDAEVDADTYVINTPMKRMAEPLEVSKGVAFLLSDDASFITGTDLVIDGGYLAR